MKFNVLFPERLSDEEYMKSQYSGLKITATDFYTMGIQVEQYSYAKKMKLLSIPVDLEEWDLAPQESLAYYNRFKNTFVITASQLAAPYFYPSDPKSVQFGSLGSVIGHEITHGFDTDGRFFDDIGKFVRQWWSNRSFEGFRNRSTCFVNQYGAFKSMSGKRVNGTATLSENIADNGGMRLAWNAYKAHMKQQQTQAKLGNFTQDQWFFIGFAQNWCTAAFSSKTIDLLLSLAPKHTPHPFRVKGVLDNMPEFHQAFSCPAPTQPQCQLW